MQVALALRFRRALSAEALSITPGGLFTQPKAEDTQLVRTANNVRLRTNRAVVIVVQE